jgi:hypothetical protein
MMEAAGIEPAQDFNRSEKDGARLSQCSGIPRASVVRGIRSRRSGKETLPFFGAGYSRMSIAAASRSRSMYASPLTSTATRRIVPPVKCQGSVPG